MVHIAESTVGRRYAGWFIKNTERTQKILDDLKNMPLPVSSKPAGAGTGQVAAPDAPTQTKGGRGGGQKVAWGGVKVSS